MRETKCPYCHGPMAVCWDKDREPHFWCEGPGDCGDVCLPGQCWNAYDGEHGDSPHDCNPDWCGIYDPHRPHQYPDKHKETK